MYLKSIEEKQKRDEERKAERNNFKSVQKSFIFKNIYNTRKWRYMRIAKMREQPLCEMCMNKGLYTLATQVHHITFITQGKNEKEMLNLGFDYENLMSICDKCHKEIHERKEEYFLFE